MNAVQTITRVPKKRTKRGKASWKPLLLILLAGTLTIGGVLAAADVFRSSYHPDRANP